MNTTYYIGLDVHKDSIFTTELETPAYQTAKRPTPTTELEALTLTYFTPKRKDADKQAHPRERVSRHRENPSIHARKQGESRELHNTRRLQEKRSHSTVYYGSAIIHRGNNRSEKGKTQPLEPVKSYTAQDFKRNPHIPYNQAVKNRQRV